MVPPLLDGDPSLAEWEGDLPIDRLIARPDVEALDVSILLWGGRHVTGRGLPTPQIHSRTALAMPPCHYQTPSELVRRKGSS